MMDWLLPLTGLVLVAAALVQFGMWARGSLRQISYQKKHHEASLKLLQLQIEAAALVGDAEHGIEPDNSTTAKRPKHLLAWNGFRKFRVSKILKETRDCCSVYLQPLDGKRLPPFLPGQHLTLNLALPGNPKPVTRCYSLSDAPSEDAYRVTVKRAKPPADVDNVAPGLVSTFINQDLNVGDIIDVKAPAGSFHMDNSERPMVLLAGGVGITPMISMINTVLASGSQRQILLVYGVNNGHEHIFRDHLDQISKQSDNIHVINCYSQPEEDDRTHSRFHVHGHVSVDVVRKAVPSRDFDFYLCGPPPFMASVYRGLAEWGVDENRIRYEAFGPASIKQMKTRDENVESQQDITENALSVPVRFTNSNKIANWNNSCDNLLDFAESQGVEIESGCRAGSCGTCMTRLLKGHVRYDSSNPDCPDGWCLPCVAKPDEPVDLET